MEGLEYEQNEVELMNWFENNAIEITWYSSQMQEFDPDAQTCAVIVEIDREEVEALQMHEIDDKLKICLSKTSKLVKIYGYKVMSSGRSSDIVNGLPKPSIFMYLIKANQ